MTPAYDDDEIALPLLRPASRTKAARRTGAEGDIPPSQRRDYRDLARPETEGEALLIVRRPDRMRPGTAGAVMGLLAGAAGLGVVHAMNVVAISQGIARTGESLGLPPDASMPLAYLAAAVGGALIGAGFASVTQNLRRSLVAMLVWALVFFVSLTMLALALSSAYGRGLGVSMAPAILLASAVFAVIASFQLPLRRRA